MSGTFLKGFEEPVSVTSKYKLLERQVVELKEFCAKEKISLDECTTRVMLEFVSNSRFMREFRKQKAG